MTDFLFATPGEADFRTYTADVQAMQRDMDATIEIIYQY